VAVGRAAWCLRQLRWQLAFGVQRPFAVRILALPFAFQLVNQSCKDTMRFWWQVACKQRPALVVHLFLEHETIRTSNDNSNMTRPQLMKWHSASATIYQCLERERQRWVAWDNVQALFPQATGSDATKQHAKEGQQQTTDAHRQGGGPVCCHGSLPCLPRALVQSHMPTAHWATQPRVRYARHQLATSVTQDHLHHTPLHHLLHPSPPPSGRLHARHSQQLEAPAVAHVVHRPGVAQHFRGAASAPVHQQRSCGCCGVAASYTSSSDTSSDLQLLLLWRG
jgi:hypothetical protein